VVVELPRPFLAPQGMSVGEDICQRVGPEVHQIVEMLISIVYARYELCLGHHLWGPNMSKNGIKMSPGTLTEGKKGVTV
jgi:hypothetical protein